MYILLFDVFNSILFDVFNWCSFSKGINKGMSNNYYWENWRSQSLSEKSISRKENLKKCTSFEEQKGTRYIWGNVYFDIIVFSCFSSTKPCLKIYFNLFCSGDKKILSEFLRKSGWFQGHNERFPKYLC